MAYSLLDLIKASDACPKEVREAIRWARPLPEAIDARIEKNRCIDARRFRLSPGRPAHLPHRPTARGLLASDG
jgi:hypothetical protein